MLVPARLRQQTSPAPFLLQAPQAFEIKGFVGGAIRALRFPECLGQTLDHTVFRRMWITVTRRERLVNLRNAGRPVRRHLLADAEMQP
jgi:hypothetical protein